MKDKFIHDWITDYCGNNEGYEAYAEKEDLANAMNAAIEWTTERAKEWLKDHINDYLTHGRDIDLIFEDIKNIKL